MATRVSLLNRLRKAIQKVKLLLSSNIIQRWRVVSLIRRGSLGQRRHLSFDDRNGLQLCYEETESEGSGSSSSSSHGRGLVRTTSCTSEDDIDRKADMFIANFRRQLQMERQVSLQLRYLRGNSFESVVSP